MKKFFYLVVLFLISVFIAISLTGFGGKQQKQKITLKKTRVKTVKLKENVQMVFSVRSEPCRIERGDVINQESFINKRRYAQLMGYDIYYNNQTLDKDLNITGTYTKISLLRQLILNESKLDADSPLRHDWFLWIDSDALIVDMKFELPFQKYNNVELVIWGSDPDIYETHCGNNGVNTGVFLIRNSKWSLQFLEHVRSFGVNEGVAREHELKPFIRNYVRALYEQNAIVYILNHEPNHKYRDKMYFEQSFALNGYWNSTFEIPNWNPFVIHFMGCQFCWYTPKNNCHDVWDQYVDKSYHSYKKQLYLIHKRLI